MHGHSPGNWLLGIRPKGTGGSASGLLSFSKPRSKISGWRKSLNLLASEVCT